ncbi:hypothetical protein LguiA_025262 [Lonicera macranthoides]
MQRISIDKPRLSLCDRKKDQHIKSSQLFTLAGILIPPSPADGIPSNPMSSIPNSPESPSLRRALELTSSLISQSFSIKPFSTKWQLIRTKLEELLSCLTAVENSDSGQNPSIFGVIQAIIDTLCRSKDLARQCRELCFSGKLLMQSDLDILSTKFDYHLKSLSDIYKAELLTQNSAIVVPKPGIGASKDDMKFYIGDLLSRLKIGDSHMKKRGLIALNEVIQEDEKYIKILVEANSLISILVNFLDFEEIEIQEEATKAVLGIARSELYRGVLLGNGIIAPLIRVLESGSGLGKEFAARCLMKFTENSNNAWSVSAQGGVTALLKICRNCDCGVELFSLGCVVLKNLVGVEEIKRFMVEEGAIELFTKLVKSKDEVTQMCSMDFLTTMAFGDEKIRHLIVREGGIRVIVRILDPKSLSSCKAREVALRAIASLCSNSAASLHSLMNYGFMDHIHYFLRNGEVSVQEMALKAALWLCGTSEEAKKAMGDTGFMPELVKFLDAKSFEVREMAAETLCGMVSVPRNRKKFVQNDQSVAFLLQLLDPEEANSVSRKLLLSILMSLTSCNSGRKKISKSGYLQNIEKLADAEVSDAKKIIRKLSTNRFRSILGGMLHF